MACYTIVAWFERRQCGFASTAAAAPVGADVPLEQCEVRERLFDDEHAAKEALLPLASAFFRELLERGDAVEGFRAQQLECSAPAMALLMGSPAGGTSLPELPVLFR